MFINIFYNISCVLWSHVHKNNFYYVTSYFYNNNNNSNSDECGQFGSFYSSRYACIINNAQIISNDEDDKMILKQFNDLQSAIKNRKSKKNKNNKEINIVVNCYLNWDDHVEEKSYLEKMHNEIINMPVKESLRSLHKFGYLGYFREEAYDGAGEISAVKHLFSEAWLEEEEQNSIKKDKYCKVNSDVLKARLSKAIEITMQREKKLEDNKNNKNKNKDKTTRKRRRTGLQDQEKQQHKEEDYNARVKSLKDFVQLFEQKEKEGKNPRVYVSY